MSRPETASGRGAATGAASRLPGAKSALPAKAVEERATGFSFDCRRRFRRFRIENHQGKARCRTRWRESRLSPTMPIQFSRRPDAVVGAMRINSPHRNDGQGVDMNVRNQSLALFAAAFTLATPALAEEVKRVGVIMSMSEGQLNLRTREGPLTVVMT